MCGDFNGGAECGAVRYLEDGSVDETFLEDGEPVSSGPKVLPLEKPMQDVVAMVDRTPPATLVVSELISTMVRPGDEPFENPSLSDAVVERLTRIYQRFATHSSGDVGEKCMNVPDVEKWLTAINLQVGRGSEFREAARQMGWKEEEKEDDDSAVEQEKPKIELPADGILSLQGFINVYQAELRQGKFWGIAYDLAALGEALPDAGVFQSRYDRMYCSSALKVTAVMDFTCSKPCPNEVEPSDHLPVAASFAIPTDR